MDDFDFDYWKDLAAASRSEFESQRRQTLQEFANRAPVSKQPALNALINTLCVPQQGTPMERAINAQVLMKDSLSYFHTGWTELAQAAQRALSVVQALLNDLKKFDQ
jgi:hypothetical protein